MNILRDVNVSSTGHIFDKFNVTRYGFVSHHVHKRRKILRLKFYLALGYFFRRRLQTGYFLTDNWSHNYFHWFTEALVRYVQVSEHSKALPLILPSRYQSIPYVRRSLELMEIANVIFIPQFKFFRVHELVLPNGEVDRPGRDKDALRQVGQTLKAKFSKNDQPTEKIYVSRKFAKTRAVANESDLIPILERNGICTMYCEKMSLDEQIKLFSRSKFIIGPHGAGLTNMLFMPPGGQVLELLPDSLRQDIKYHNPCYVHLAEAMNHNYQALNMTVTSEGEKYETGEFYVDPIAFERALETITI